MELEMWCPRCSQGEVVETVIKATNEAILVCKECDAMWHRRDEVGTTKFADLGTYLRALGRQPQWDELTVMS